MLNGVTDWSLQSLFDRTIHRACPVAKTSEVLVSLPMDAIYAIKPEPTTIDGNLARFDVKASKPGYNFLFSMLIRALVNEPLDVKMIWREPFVYRKQNQPNLRTY